MSTASVGRATGHHDADLGWALGVLLRAHQGALAHVLADLPHGYRGYQVLREVALGEHPSQLALAAHLGIDRTVMTYLIDDLVAAGLTERRPNEADRRQRKVVATASGIDRLAQLERGIEAADEAILAALAPGAREQLKDLLRQAACGVQGAGGERDLCLVVNEAIAGLDGAGSRA